MVVVVVVDYLVSSFFSQINFPIHVVLPMMTMQLHQSDPLKEEKKKKQ
jgi:hypothetical protein